MNVLKYAKSVCHFESSSDPGRCIPVWRFRGKGHPRNSWFSVQDVFRPVPFLFQGVIYKLPNFVICISQDLRLLLLFLVHAANVNHAKYMFLFVG